MTDAKDWLGRVRKLEASGDLLLAYDIALQGIAEHPGDAWLAHRAVLNLAKSGATGRARAEFERLGLEASREVDIRSLDARIAKDDALRAAGAERARLLKRAADLYEAIYTETQNYYPGINAATLRLVAGEADTARRLAGELLTALRALAAASKDAHSDEIYYRAASEAEAALILRDLPAARDALARAAAASSDLAARATTRRQLRLICEAHGIEESVLDALAPPAVICYSGHIIAAPGARGRFPSGQEAQVAKAIADLLERRKVGFGYGALAAGADILFAEALLARGAELHVVLPFEREEFIEVSVAPAKARWRERFEECLARARSVTYATSDAYLGHEAIFSYGTMVMMGLAVLRARFLDAEVRQAVVWDGEETTGAAGTGFDVRTWRAYGRPSDVIRSGERATPRKPAPASPAQGRELRAMLFGDVKGFSKLKEAQIPVFVDGILGAIGGVLDRYGADVLHSNTWGDGLYVVLSGAEVAARCALDLQEAFTRLDLAKMELPDTMAFRLGGHFGPVYESWDPVRKAVAYMGAHVSRTARIEPVTPPAEVYVTEQFAARLALESAAFDCNYVGVMPAAKDFGVMRMYHLDAK